MNRHVPPPETDYEAQGAPEAGSFARRGTPDFRSAQRHSARVRFVRRILPISILLTLALIAIVPIIASFKMKIDLPFDLGRLTLSGSRLTMELPKLSGFTTDNRAYSIAANTASQDLTNPDVIDLADVSARLELANKGWATVEAKTGTFDTKKQLVSLSEGVDLAMNGGYGGKLKDALVDVKAGTIVTDHPVVFTYLDGKLVADRLTVSDRGQKALFEGHVQLDFRLNNLPGQNKGDGQGQPQGLPVAQGQAPAQGGGVRIAKPATQPGAQPAAQPGAAQPGAPRAPAPQLAIQAPPSGGAAQGVAQGAAQGVAQGTLGADGLGAFSMSSPALSYSAPAGVLSLPGVVAPGGAVPLPKPVVRP